MKIIYFITRVLFFALYYRSLIFMKLKSAFTAWNLQRLDGRVGKNFRIRKGAKIDSTKTSKIEFGENITIAENAIIFVGRNGRLKIGDGVFLGKGTFIVANEEVIIESNTQVAHYTTIIDSDHKTGAMGSPASVTDFVTTPIHISSNVWIGAQVVVLRGVQIGEGAIVGAGSIVTKSVPARKTVVGNPARIK